MGNLRDLELYMTLNILVIDTFTEANGEEGLAMEEAIMYTQINHNTMGNGWIIGNMVKGLIPLHKVSIQVSGVMERDTAMEL